MQKITFWALLFVAGALAANIVGCGSETNGTSTSGPQACTLIGCGSAFQVEFTRASWPAGKVDIVVVADGTTTNCSVTLPYASCDNLVQCDNANPGFLIETSGCALPAAQHTITGVTWPQDGPEQATITVSQEGSMLGMQTFMPMYEMVRPNGPDCDPACNQATTPGMMMF